jgi:integrase
MAENLIRRGKNYSARLHIPTDLQETIGRAEVVKSLRTSNKSQAKLLLRRLQFATERLFFIARAGMVDRGKLTGILTRYMEEVLTNWAENRGRLMESGFDLSETTGDYYLGEGGDKLHSSEQFKLIAEGVQRDYFVNGRKEYVHAMAQRHLKSEGVELPTDSPEFLKFSDDFAKVMVWAQEELSSRESGNFKYDYRERVERMVQEGYPVTLKQAVEEWFKNKELASLKSDTVETYKSMARIVQGFYGDPYAVKNLNNRELMRFVESQQAGGVKNTTINQRKGFIQDVVRLASANHGFVLPTYSIKLKDDKADVLPYTADELNQMFNVMNSKKIPSWGYWAILVSILSGLRQSEVCDLLVKDVRQAGEVWFFYVRDAKTKAGIRSVPVSDVLLQLGFLGFLLERQRSGESHLFMCRLPPSKQRSASVYAPLPASKYQDFFRNSIRGKCKITLKEGQKKDHHSLRHNFADSLKQGRVAAEYRDELCGHAGKTGSAMRDVYDEQYGVAILAEELRKAKWECDFSLLKTWKG